MHCFVFDCYDRPCLAQTVLRLIVTIGTVVVCTVFDCTMIISKNNPYIARHTSKAKPVDDGVQ